MVFQYQIQLRKPEEGSWGAVVGGGAFRLNSEPILGPLLEVCISASLEGSDPVLFTFQLSTIPGM